MRYHFAILLCLCWATAAYGLRLPPTAQQAFQCTDLRQSANLPVSTTATAITKVNTQRCGLVLYNTGPTPVRCTPAARDFSYVRAFTVEPYSRGTATDEIPEQWKCKTESAQTTMMAVEFFPNN